MQALSNRSGLERWWVPTASLVFGVGMLAWVVLSSYGGGGTCHVPDAEDSDDRRIRQALAVMGPTPAMPVAWSPPVRSVVVTADGGGVTLPTAGVGAVAFAVTGTWTGAVVFAATEDGQTWTPALFAPNGVDAGASSTQTTTDGIWIANTSGHAWQQVSAVCAPLRSGTPTLTAIGILGAH